jgi:hypothetical protein
MTTRVTVSGIYCNRASRHVSSTWPLICAEHEEEFPEIHSCYRGTFNITLTEAYSPPNEFVLRQKAKERGRSVNRYVDGNHVSPYAKVVDING